MQLWILCEQWVDIPEDAYLYSSTFSGCVNRRTLEFLFLSNDTGGPFVSAAQGRAFGACRAG
ncbi:hypothetical protein HMPREF1870_01046 [Bacteroidales bacterium KA00344]|nr:hypothetical protein HMPREF1870_01046 [Bacteroidales bacterium KA00344]